MDTPKCIKCNGTDYVDWFSHKCLTCQQAEMPTGRTEHEGNEMKLVYRIARKLRGLVCYGCGCEKSCKYDPTVSRNDEE